MRKHNRLFITIALLLLVLVVGGMWALLGDHAVRVETKDSGIYLPGISPTETEAVEYESFEGLIYDGIHLGAVDVSGMTVEEARVAVEQYLDGMYDTEVTLIAAQDNAVSVTLRALAPYWVNTDVINTLLDLTEGANAIERYMVTKDIEQEGMELPLVVSFDKEVVVPFLRENCSIYDVPMRSPTLSREDGTFVVEEGQEGEGVNIAESSAMIENTLFDKVVAGERTFQLPIEELLPVGAADQLSRVHDLLGSFTTSFSTSGTNRSANVRNGCSLIDGITLYPGEEFSAYSAVSPFSTENGYYLAGSYMQGKVVDSLGGGICQVSSTLYNAVLRAELQVTERHNHSMIVTYVDRSADAAIAESSGKDFRFINSTDYPIYIEGYCEGKKITFNIYGVETRPAGRTLKYESVTLTETQPATETIIADAGQVVGYVSVSSAHIGYKAQLWKVVYENGVEVERSQVNESNYSPSPRTAVVGIAAINPEYTAMMQAAIASGSIDTCKATAAQILAAAQAAQEAQAQVQDASQPVVTEVAAQDSDSVAP